MLEPPSRLSTDQLFVYNSDSGPKRMTSTVRIEDTNASSILPDQTCVSLTLADIESATNNFDEALVIGRGGFGLVYKSVSKFGSVNEVAIKKLHSTSSQGANEFEAEVKILSKLRHGNLVPLIGYCSEGSEMVLVYEFMPNGTLEDHLHRGGTELSWLQRLKICIGAARGLDYLHTGPSTQHGVIHRDVKTSNILLDSNFAAKISDFGLAKVSNINQTRTHVSTLIKGTYGYIDPNYYNCGKLTRKSDVYSFGVVLFEVLTGKQAVDPTFDEDLPSLAVWAQHHFKERKLNDIIDHRLMGQISKKCLKEFASIAVQCLHNQPKQRPTMAKVVFKLESLLSIEKEHVGSHVYDGRFINKVRYLFTGKANLMSTLAEDSKSEIIDKSHAEGSKPEISDKSHAEGSKSEISDEYIKKSSNQIIRTFTYAEMVSATNDWPYAELIDSSEFVRKGWVDELTYAPTEPGIGLAIYVKRKRVRLSKLDLDINADEFDHPNLVKLLGYCLEMQNLFYAYKLVPGTSLDRLLFGGQDTSSLSWFARLKIACAAANGLSFLHKKGRPSYNQFKTACILVEPDYDAQLWDFEIDDSCVACGSYSFKMDAPYSAPEWFHYQADVVLEDVNVSHDFIKGFGLNSEIYSFGVVLLELLTGMKVFDQNRSQGKKNLVKWAAPLLAHEENLGMIMDKQLQDNNLPPKGAFIFAKLVSNCLQPAQDARPSIENVLQVLRECYQEAV